MENILNKWSKGLNVVSCFFLIGVSIILWALFFFMVKEVKVHTCIYLQLQYNTTSQRHLCIVRKPTWHLCLRFTLISGSTWQYCPLLLFFLSRGKPANGSRRPWTALMNKSVSREDGRPSFSSKTQCYWLVDKASVPNKDIYQSGWNWGGQTHTHSSHHLLFMPPG